MENVNQAYIGLAVIAAIIVIGFWLYQRKRKQELNEAWRLRMEEEKLREEERKKEEDARLKRLKAEEEARARQAVVEIPPPPEGNVFEIPGETLPPPDDDKHHLFPDRRKPVTRFEEFNWFLFIAHTRTDAKGVWPDTVVNDFATHIQVKDQSQLNSHIYSRLRPLYPVIYDGLGWWSATSRKLEMSPDDSDIVADVYLSLPPDRRPVVVSPVSPTGGSLIFYRYGFQAISITPAQIQPFGADALRYILNAFTGDPKGWQWFSVARMRQELSRKHRELEEQNHVKATLEAEKARLAHENRFVVLFDLVERPEEPGHEREETQETASGSSQ